MAAPRLWSKLDSDADVLSPTIGVGGSIIGTANYQTAKFGNGVISWSDNSGVKFPTAANNINMDKGAIEFWAHMRHATGPGDTLRHAYFSFTDTDGIYLRNEKYLTQGKKLRVYVGHAGGSFTVYSDVQNWVIGELIHWALAWDRQGQDIGDNKTVILFRNGIEIASSTTTWNESTGVSSDIYIGIKNDGGAHSDMRIDNLKIYNLVKTDFSDREIEESSWFRGEMEKQTLHPMRRFIYDGIIETARVKDFGVISRTSDMITSGGATITLINTDQYWNKFKSDRSNLRRMAKLQIGFGIQGTIARSGIARSGITVSNLVALAAGSTTKTAAYILGWGEMLELFTGWGDDPEFEEVLVSLPLRDKFANLLEIEVGSDESPVDYYSSSYNPADLFWAIVTTHGGFDSTQSTDNTDIDYTSWSNWKSACTTATLSLKARLTGQSIGQILELIRDLTNSYIHACGDGRLRFSRPTDISQPGQNFLFNKDNLKNLKVKFDSEKLINSLRTYYGYDPTGDTWAGNYLYEDTPSRSTYRKVSKTIDSKVVWHATSASAISYTHRRIAIFKEPLEVISFQTFLMGMPVNIGDRIRFTDELQGYSEAYFTVYKINSLDLNTGTVTLEAFLSRNINIYSATLDLMEYFTDFLAQAAWVTSIPPTAPADCQLWSKLDSNADVASPQIGTGGGVFGNPSYAPCKFANGILSDTNEGANFPTTVNNINIDKGTIEFWLKLNYSNTDGDLHYFFDFFSIYPGWTGIKFLYDKDASQSNRLYVEVSVNSVIKAQFWVTKSWSVGTLMHCAVVWDRTGSDIGGGKTLAMYIDNVQVGSDTATWSAGTINPNLYIGARHTQVLHSDAVIDNLKTYKICKTDFSDRNEEYGVKLQSYCEATIKQQGTHSLRIFAKATESLNETLTRTPSPTIDLSNLDVIIFSVRASRTGSNFKIAIHDSGGTTTEHTVNIRAADTWQLEIWTIVGVSNPNKDAIDEIKITIINADADNFIYVDDIEAYSY